MKILGSGELTAKATFEVAAASKSAVAAIEKAGGSLKTLREAPVAAAPLSGTPPPGWRWRARTTI